MSNAVAPMSAAERAREFRRRRRDGTRILAIEVRNDEVDAMVAHGLLHANQRDDRYAVIAALYGVLDRAFAALEAGTLRELSDP